ncbi:hypothetical protein ILUMI_13978 [Ignelater luminosus]|uniref:Uncharacterized protein n=1 Tax=Ignelater luminosus TaxID=2038154 RepID=A0A8K0G864_IGNLU|nr:hypothetical protein ILUMI_13978 [Ignelater luminosus]
MVSHLDLKLFQENFHGTEMLYEHLRLLFQKSINLNEIPGEWKMSYLNTTYKKGKKNKGDNYRGIAVTGAMSRIYKKVLANRVEKEYQDKEAEEQAK